MPQRGPASQPSVGRCKKKSQRHVPFFADKERQRLADKARKEDERRRDERKKLEKQEMKTKKASQLQELNADAATKAAGSSPTPAAATTVSAAAAPTAKPTVSAADKASYKKAEQLKKEKAKERADAQAVQHLQERPKVAHAQSHQIAHSEPVNLRFFFIFSFPFTRVWWSNSIEKRLALFNTDHITAKLRENQVGRGISLMLVSLTPKNEMSILLQLWVIDYLVEKQRG